ncbi:MAG: ATP-binding protein [Lachnospiraceae bacterium]
MEFTSIGGLVSGITLDDVLMGISVCRNAKLANIFYRLKLIEAYGTGIQKIFNAYANSAQKPRIETSSHAFKITLPNMNFITNAKQPKIAPNNSIDSVLSLAEKQQTITRKEVEQLLGISQTASGRLLKEMTQKHLLVQEGRGKSTRYRRP